jgi:carbonic anhydrase
VTHRDMNRRRILGLAAAGAAALAGGPMAGRPLWAESPSRPPIPPDLTPDQALALLYEGNQRFTEGKIEAPHRSMARLKAVAPKQAPFAAILGCADSRVPVEIVFDQGFGDLFVARVAGNLLDAAIIGSLEYGCLVLGARVVLVLGHSNCGAVSAAIAGTAVPGQISTLYQHLEPAVSSAKGDLATATTNNVRIQAELLAGSSPVISGLIKDGKVKVAGGVYDLDSGKVTPVT